jgi:hypothetical protein
MTRLRLLTLVLPLTITLSCNEPEPDTGMETGRDNAIIKADSLPQDHAATAPDSTKNTPGMNIGK